jgi:hypothetical protein
MSTKSESNVAKRKPAKAGLLLTTYHIVRRQQASILLVPVL